MYICISVTIWWLGYVKHLTLLKEKFSMKQQKKPYSKNLNFQPNLESVAKVTAIKEGNDGFYHKIIIEFSRYLKRLVK